MDSNLKVRITKIYQKKIIFFIKKKNISKFKNNSHKIISNWSFLEGYIGIKKALNFADNKDVLVLIGDTFFKVNLRKMKDFHLKNKADLTIAVKKMENIKRYGTLTFDENFKVLSFNEKVFKKFGYINGGIYILNKDIKFPEEDIFLFEDFIKDIQNVYAFVDNNYFIDIGIKEDYYKAKEELSDYI